MCAGDRPDHGGGRAPGSRPRTAWGEGTRSARGTRCRGSRWSPGRSRSAPPARLRARFRPASREPSPSSRPRTRASSSATRAPGTPCSSPAGRAATQARHERRSPMRRGRNDRYHWNDYAQDPVSQHRPRRQGLRSRRLCASNASVVTASRAPPRVSVRVCSRGDDASHAAPLPVPLAESLEGQRGADAGSHCRRRSPPRAPPARAAARRVSSS